MDRAVIIKYLATAASATDSDAQGKAYEALVAYLFGCVPGCLVEPGIINVFGTEQIDVAVGNVRSESGLYLLPRIFLVECKDWTQPVDSKTVGYFLNILAGRGVEVGVLVAANGITGDLANLTHAHALGLTAAPRGIKLVVITSEEIAVLCNVDDLVMLLHRRLLRAYATGTVGVP
jgi:hypothetical protein